MHVIPSFLSGLLVHQTTVRKKKCLLQVFDYLSSFEQLHQCQYLLGVVILVWIGQHHCWNASRLNSARCITTHHLLFDGVAQEKYLNIKIKVHVR